MSDDQSVWDAISNTAWGRTTVSLEPTVSETTSAFFARAPQLEIPTQQEQSEALAWRPQEWHERFDLSEVFWEFLKLRSAEDESFITFAATYGPLTVPQGPERHVEQVEDWRSLSRGLNAAYNLALARQGWSSESSEIRQNAFLTITVPILMSAQSRQSRSALDHDRFASWVAVDGIEVLQRLSGQAFETQILNGALNAAAIGPGMDLTEKPRGAQYLAIPTSVVSPPREVEGVVKHQAEGLLPILTLSLAAAMRSLERPRCSLCGEPARKIKRAPRPDQPWYGDHDACRAQAHLRSVTRTNANRAQAARNRGATRPT